MGYADTHPRATLWAGTAIAVLVQATLIALLETTPVLAHWPEIVAIGVFTNVYARVLLREHLTAKRDPR